MATVRIPTPLRSFTGGKDEITVAGATVAEVVTNLRAGHPDLAARICDPTGKMRRFINLYLNDQDIRSLQGEASPVAAGAVMAIVPAIAGGR